jgi:hypothetical protein
LSCHWAQQVERAGEMIFFVLQQCGEIKVPDEPLDEMVSEAITLEDNAPLRVMEFLGFD